MEPTHKSRLALAVITAIASLLILGCGGGNDNVETSNPLPKDQFLKRGNQICRKGLEEKDAVVKAAVEKANGEEGGQPSKQRQEEVAEDIVAAFRRIEAGLDELSPPEEGEPAVEEITGGLETGIKRAEEDPISLFRTNLFEDASSTARAYGLEACSF